MRKKSKNEHPLIKIRKLLKQNPSKELELINAGKDLFIYAYRYKLSKPSGKATKIVVLDKNLVKIYKNNLLIFIWDFERLGWEGALKRFRENLLQDFENLVKHRFREINFPRGMGLYIEYLKIIALLKELNLKESHNPKLLFKEKFPEFPEEDLVGDWWKNTKSLACKILASKYGISFTTLYYEHLPYARRLYKHCLGSLTAPPPTFTPSRYYS